MSLTKLLFDNFGHKVIKIWKKDQAKLVLYILEKV